MSRHHTDDAVWNKTAPLFTVLVFSLLSCMSAIAEKGQGAAVPEQKLEPKMRVMDRDWSYFKGIPCDELHRAVFHSKSEQRLLTKRKNQCLNKFRAFLPKPIEP